MLVHMISETEGQGVDSVVLLDATIFRFRIGDTCHSGIRVQSSGVLQYIQSDGGFSSQSGQWLNNGTPSDFYIQRTIITGTLEVDPGPGFLQLNLSRTYDNQKSSVGVKTTEMFFEISDDVSGIPVVASASMTFISDRDAGGA